MEKKDIRKSQGGFTLIEIIAVLVILGILAAVAVSRFLDFQAKARNSAIEGAFAAGASQLSMIYAADLLRGDATQDSWTHAEEGDCGVSLVLSEFTVNLTCACGDGSATVLVEDEGSPDWVADVAGDDKTRDYTICGG